MLSLGIAGAATVIFFLVLTGAGLLLAMIFGGEEALQRELAVWNTENDSTFLSKLTLDLILAALIPCTLVAVWFGNRGCPKLVHSVVGRFRWKWALRCGIALLPLWVVYIAVDQFFTAPEGSRPESNLLMLIFLAIFVTPLQAAGEEYFFRGWIMQNVGAWFEDPRKALIISGVVSTVVFAWIHGSTDFWVLVDLGTTAVACVYLTWRTGGLEAAVALHTVNNSVVGIITAIAGTASASNVSEATTGSFFATMISIGIHVAAVLILLRLTRDADLDVHAQEPYAIRANSQLS
ncbi:CPBP family intramembrane glutamic endopeptidase [Dermatophilus congolensis]|uniref:CAAX amino terminal protease self- immunity n=1 Tax=Dermatophilus congolensis TaxID=1863 RepID=A0A239VKG2_9MICO|nr:CPBP family intramembrane glutamic endopeptidase [Dermatophilus congolensis]MBO3129187.1 CPBP family intramembrane metalloprotease [Dermatophilus congolensis]MBO3132179.1 CPBP family intramembrane metalloprotease [Dermatophilus congolensis]MBO3133665.1 CPBP family intramembrane metalloprotease [Dermatophilus congolensis]MBO3135898.1 CPBP family intramembrane metalloprotease [Dermatophilus congolensis]MBO3138137.1 CPBP family intramembrane metalloprotease [Dermatophilus congolensis]